MRVVVSGGGTGGHIFPALAVADRLKERDPSIEILFIGAEGKMEMEKVPKAGYRIVGLPVSGIKRELNADNLKVPFRVIRSLFEVRKVIREFQPDIAVGFGGYASGPALWVASGMGIPTILQEQNSYAGLTNKILARKAKAVCVAYPGMEKFFPSEKIVQTGNPVRSDLLNSNIDKREALGEYDLQEDKKTLLVFGGSLGARTLNEALNGATEILRERNDVQVLWQMGKLYAERFGKSETAGLANVRAVPFIDRMDLAYAAADVAMCRAGALTVSELCAVGLPAVLIPSPNVAEDHQTHNARALVERNAALMVHDSEAADRAVDVAIGLLDDDSRRSELAASALALAIPDATDRIVDEITKLVPA